MYHRITLPAIVLASLALTGAASAKSIIPSPASQRVEVHGEAGLTVSSGLENVLDQMETNFGVDRDSIIPISFRFAGYVKYPNGIGIGASLGPCHFINVEDDDRYYHHHNDDWSYIMPVSADLRYYFPTGSNLAPYVRAGVSYPISGGEHLGRGTPGPVAAIGSHVWQSHWVGIGVEAGYDGSKVKVKAGDFHGAEKVRPVEFTFSVYAVF